MIIKYTERLGAIIRILPLARYFANKGYETQIACKEQYHGIFEHVPYCKPAHPESPCDYDLTIWPNKFQEYRNSGLTWLQFVYKQFPAAPVNSLFKAFAKEPLFEISEKARQDFINLYSPQNCKIAFPFQYSEATNPAEMMKLCPFKPTLIAAPPEVAEALDNPYVVAFRQQDLPLWIEYAEEIFTVNSAPSIIAGAVREKPYYHVIGNAGDQDDWKAPNQIRIPQI